MIKMCALQVKDREEAAGATLSNADLPSPYIPFSRSSDPLDPGLLATRAGLARVKAHLARGTRPRAQPDVSRTRPRPDRSCCG
jgi:hypothetical protein